MTALVPLGDIPFDLALNVGHMFAVLCYRLIALTLGRVIVHVVLLIDRDALVLVRQHALDETLAIDQRLDHLVLDGGSNEFSAVFGGVVGVIRAVAIGGRRVIGRIRGAPGPLGAIRSPDPPFVLVVDFLELPGLWTPGVHHRHIVVGLLGHELIQWRHHECPYTRFGG
ncbi:Uncharacterised protein [Mycobacteroides abscessus subsp. abscessus]|nr:Uncharacterised protein [Mycobacteroides abscessus subsp. abscessus]